MHTAWQATSGPRNKINISNFPYDTHTDTHTLEQEQSAQCTTPRSTKF